MKTLLTTTMLVLGMAAASAAQDANARIRVVHASPDAPHVDVWVDGARVLSNLPYREYSEYLSLPAKGYDIRVTPSGSTTVVLQASPVLAAGKDYTVLAVGRVSGGSQPLSVLLLTDENNVEPAPGNVKMRVVHGAPGAPDVDVYVTTPYEALDAKTPVLSGVPFKAASGYLTVPVQMYQARVAVAGTKTIAIDTGRLPTWSGAVRTIVAVDAVGGGAPFDVIILPDRN